MAKDTLIKEFLLCLMLLSVTQCYTVEDDCQVEEFYNDDGIERRKCYDENPQRNRGIYVFSNNK